ncbi:hypothetical protein ACN4EK_13170 [Pantanalinema rosaneae CENA516]|uniref:hypothetical protein n=1 Tax=Pantanalinema rosaneae TaxID=1620701 RepID=UPI003D6DF172
MANQVSEKHWHLVELYQNCPPPMHPAQFLQHWEVDYPSLSRLLKISRSTIEHWFIQGSSYREPGAIYCRRLGEIHFLWSNADRITPELIQLWCNSCK